MTATPSIWGRSMKTALHCSTRFACSPSVTCPCSADSGGTSRGSVRMTQHEGRRALFLDDESSHRSPVPTVMVGSHHPTHQASGSAASPLVLAQHRSSICAPYKHSPPVVCLGCLALLLGAPTIAVPPASAWSVRCSTSADHGSMISVVSPKRSSTSDVHRRISAAVLEVSRRTPSFSRFSHTDSPDHARPNPTPRGLVKQRTEFTSIESIGKVLLLNLSRKVNSWTTPWRLRNTPRNPEGSITPKVEQATMRG